MVHAVHGWCWVCRVATTVRPHEEGPSAYYKYCIGSRTCIHTYYYTISLHWYTNFCNVFFLLVKVCFCSFLKSCSFQEKLLETFSLSPIDPQWFFQTLAPPHFIYIISNFWLIHFNNTRQVLWRGGGIKAWPESTFDTSSVTEIWHETPQGCQHLISGLHGIPCQYSLHRTSMRSLQFVILGIQNQGTLSQGVQKSNIKMLQLAVKQLRGLSTWCAPFLTWSSIDFLISVFPLAGTNQTNIQLCFPNQTHLGSIYQKLKYFTGKIRHMHIHM